MIGTALALYEENHEGMIPRRFEDLRAYLGENSTGILVCPSAKDGSVPSYEILLGGKNTKTEAPTEIVVVESALNHRFGRNALYVDGHVQFNPDQGTRPE